MELKVIVSIPIYQLDPDLSVRKCPPNYNTQEGEYVVELEDYTEDDIKNYFHTFHGN